MDGGTVAATLSLLSVTVIPEGPAAPLRLTVPVEEAPPCTELGFRVREDRVAGVMVSVAL